MQSSFGRTGYIAVGRHSKFQQNVSKIAPCGLKAKVHVPISVGQMDTALISA